MIATGVVVIYQGALKWRNISRLCGKGDRFKRLLENSNLGLVSKKPRSQSEIALVKLLFKSMRTKLLVLPNWLLLRWQRRPNQWKHRKFTGSTDGAVDKRSHPTSVTRVRFPYSPSRVGWVYCWFSPCSKGFSPGSPVFLPRQKPTLLNSNSM